MCVIRFFIHKTAAAGEMRLTGKRRLCICRSC
jgi:hypothetical protein